MSALFGGAVWAAAMLAGYDAADGAYVPRDARVLALSFAVCYAAVTLFLRRRAQAPGARRGWTVTLGGAAASLRALADTGNALADPVSGRAAAVCDAAALAPLLGGVYRGDGGRVWTRPRANPGLAGRALLIPYSAVGSRGLLAAVRPDSPPWTARRASSCSRSRPSRSAEASRR